MQTTIIEPRTEKWYAHITRSGIGQLSDDPRYLFDHEGLPLKEIFPIEIRVVGPALCRDNCEECEGCMMGSKFLNL